MNVYVRFECGQENRVSQEYGPFSFVRLTYDDALHIGPNGQDFAHFLYGMWYKTGRSEPWSDVAIYSKYSPLRV